MNSLEKTFLISVLMKYFTGLKINLDIKVNIRNDFQHDLLVGRANVNF